MQNTTIPVSVIVPNYNSGGHYLRECIESIDNSRQWPTEILIIDDCSTDGSLELAMKLQSEYSNVRLIKREVNGGIAAARWSGIAEATQDLLAPVDADDCLEKDALEEAYARIKSSGADICLWDLWRFDEHKTWRHDANRDDFPKTGMEAALLTLGRWRIHAFGMSRKCLFEKAYQGFTETTTNADELLGRLVFSHAAQVVGCNKKYLYRSNPESASRALKPRRLSSLRSHLWLLDFSRRFPTPPTNEMVRGAIWEAWMYWTHRKEIGVSETLQELRRFLPGIYRVPGLWSFLWRNPKYLGALLILSIAVRVPV
jgi:glycosyltransferase involved in cell wall biosynthesis